MIFDKIQLYFLWAFFIYTQVEHSKEHKEAPNKKKSTSAQDLPSTSKRPPRRSNVVITSNALAGTIKTVSPSKKLMEKSKRQGNEVSERLKPTVAVKSESNELKVSERRRSARIVGKKRTPELENEKAEKPISSSSKVTKMEEVVEKETEEEELPVQRNYWVEYYDEMERRWICELLI